MPNFSKLDPKREKDLTESGGLAKQTLQKQEKIRQTFMTNLKENLKYVVIPRIINLIMNEIFRNNF